MQVAADGFKVLDNEFGQVEIETDLRVTGDALRIRKSPERSRPKPGRIEVDRLLDCCGIRIAPKRLWRRPRRPKCHRPPADSTATSGSLYDAATVDVRVRLPDDLLLRGRNMHASFSRIGLGDMNITVGGDLRIRKAPAGDPDVIGTVTVVRGFYDFQGRRFEVLRDSQIRFQGARPVDPSLQVDAQRVISGVTALVNIRGTARQPQIRLSSQPPLDEADVLVAHRVQSANQSAW